MSNTTPMSEKGYDQKIEKTIPFYSEFSEQIFQLVQAVGFTEASWLDTGCGTGTMVQKAANRFPMYHFTLCDPSKEMIEQSKKKLTEVSQIEAYYVCGSDTLNMTEQFDIVTAVQCHHYLQPEGRKKAVQNCYRALKKSGMFLAFENFAPGSEAAKQLALTRWGTYQQAHGKTEQEAAEHLARYGKNYFPITLCEHLALLQECGFAEAEVFWLSYMQLGIYGIK